MNAICLPRRKRSTFWAFCSSRLTFFLKWEFWMILFKPEEILASNISNVGKSLPLIDRDDFNSSPESTISTSLIHDTASEGKIGTKTHLGFESYLPIRVGIVVVPLATGLPALTCTGIAPVALGFVDWRIPWQGVCVDSNMGRGLPTTFPVVWIISMYQMACFGRGST